MFDLKLSQALVLALLLARAGSPTAGAKTVEERGLRIALENERAGDDFGGEVAESELVLINAQGDRTVRRMRQRTLEVPGEGDRSIVIFEWPADVKGVRLLTWSHKTADDDQWLYLPSLRRVKRISSRGQSGSFMGSEFAFEDLGSQEVEKYSWKLVEEGDFEARPCWRLERTPKSPRSGYSRQLLWVDKEYRQPLEIEYFDRKGELLKVARFRQYRLLDRWWRPHEIEVENVQTRKHSIVRWQGRALDGGFTAAEFESESLADGN